MAPRSAPETSPEGPSSSLPGLWKYPSDRQHSTRATGDKYLAARKMDDGAEGLWRVHDKLYDLSSFTRRHPGGAHWIRLTEGTDITELFEAHHIGPKAAFLLPKYLMRDAQQPRNSPFTFHEDGFYRTLKRRAAAVLARTPAPRFTCFFNDGLAIASFVLAVAAAAYRSYALATLAGIFITFVATCSHNFTHLKDNWRQYYISLSLLSLSEWRVSHILSHHMYPNTVLDMEVEMYEPLLKFLPQPSKSFVERMAVYLAFPVMAASGFFLNVFRRISDEKYHAEDLLPLLYPAAMWMLTSASLGEVVPMYLYITVVSSFTFHLIGLTAAHHHPDIFHDGDAPREDRDWGFGQLDAVRDRADHGRSRFLGLTQFGDHALHHLFPAVDFCRLPALYPVVNETLQEFGVEYRFTNSWELFKGCFQQLARTKPNPTPPSTVIGCGHMNY